MSEQSKFGRLTYIQDGESENHLRTWVMKCDCGVVRQFSSSKVKRGQVKSCGCLHIDRNAGPKYFFHGMVGTPTYYSWNAMKSRCASKAKKYYFGRGITVCERWLKFENFLEDMGVRPDDMTLDRIDPNGNYCKENCKWSTHTEQCRNRTNNRLIEFSGKIQTIAAWVEETGFSFTVIHSRIARGWSIEKTLTQPLRKW